MPDSPARPLQAIVPFAAISAVVVLVVTGFSRGVWLPNLHNGLLALAFTFVGAYILNQRPGHREGALFLATGAVEGVMFFGRQFGHAPMAALDRWWGWLGVWPLAIALALTTLSVICFPDGRLPSRRWRWVAGAVVGVAVLCSLDSAIWPVEYSATQITTPHPLNAVAPTAIASAWELVAHPAYVAFQLTWVVAVVVRWRAADGEVRRQLAWLAGAATLSVTALLVGLAVGGTPVAGLLAATLLPVAAGWVIVHGQQTTAYAALSWLSRQGVPDELPTGIARAAAAALAAPGAALWMGPEQRLEPIGVWPESPDLGTPMSLRDLESGQQVRAVRRENEVIGAISIDRSVSDVLSTAERRLFTDLASQAALVIAHIRLGAVISRQRATGPLRSLSRRERQVLELMALGMSNTAICAQLHLSIKTVEPVVSTIFTKLGLHADPASNRRVLAVLSYLQR
ncbi:MAG: LuxR C-terminal-related transcriptional regulator [Pseudolysinimonas sp.]